MKYKNLGTTGLKVSRLVVGGSHFGEVLSKEETAEIVHAALDVGVSTFYAGDDFNAGDTERFIGAAVGHRRDDVVLIIKAGYRVGAYGNYSRQGSPKDGGEDYTSQRLRSLDDSYLWSAGVAPTSRGLSRKHLVAALDASLQRLGTDYIDVYCPHFYDPSVPIDETIETLHSFVQQGKVRYLGCSSHTPWQLVRALWASDRLGLARYEAVQVTFNMLERGALTSDIPMLAETGVSMLAATTDAGGMLTGQFSRTDERPSGGGARREYVLSFWNDATFDAMDAIRACAAELGRPPLEMAQAWVLAQPEVASLLVGPHEVSDLAPQVAAADNPLSRDELMAVNDMLRSLPANTRVRK